MIIQERIQKDLVEAMKSKNRLRLEVLRGMKAAIKNREIEKLRQLTETEVLQVLQSLVKQRKESVEQFIKGGRHDLSSREESEIRILESYLPLPVGEEEIKMVVTQVIGELQANSAKDFGRVMKSVMGKFAGKIVDGKVVDNIVRSQLGG
ncbi:MAG: glutamyl-tRNA amidotransferase [Acidobacteria bacterium]|nr:MAG: glutamyl-tRNA amidotransferase [Acidobacteriota bacterium]